METADVNLVPKVSMLIWFIRLLRKVWEFSLFRMKCTITITAVIGLLWLNITTWERSTHMLLMVLYYLLWLHISFLDSIVCSSPVMRSHCDKQGYLTFIVHCQSLLVIKEKLGSQVIWLASTCLMFYLCIWQLRRCVFEIEVLNTLM